MANVKISALTELTAPAAGDYIPIVDISEAADADKTKRITLDTLHFPVFQTIQLSSTDFDGDSFTTTAKTLIDLSAVFGVPANVSAVYVWMMYRDSDSAATETRVILAPYASADLGIILGTKVANDAWQTYTAIVPCTTDGDIYYQIVASSTDVATLDLYLEIWGYWL